MIFQYPHIDTYVILTGDVDFRPLVQLLKKHGKTVNIIYNPDNVSERLLEFADDYKDYRDLIPDETDQYTHDEDESKNKKTFSMEEAFDLLIESINQMENNKKIPTPGSVKVRMKMINDNFTGTIPGIPNWIDFINKANSRGLITYRQKKKELILSVKNKSKASKQNIFSILIKIMKSLSSNKKWITFTKINQTMIDDNIRIRNYNYTKFKKLMLEAEKRSLITLKSDGLRWWAKVK
jgi:NYN domain